MKQIENHIKEWSKDEALQCKEQGLSKREAQQCLNVAIKALGKKALEEMEKVYQ